MLGVKEFFRPETSFLAGDLPQRGVNPALDEFNGMMA
jgi:hypothetical protein